MLKSLITSKTRIKILLKFFLNYQTMCHLRGLESEFGESSNSIRMELINLENAGILNSTVKGNKKLYYANTNYPLFSEINSMLNKFVGIDQIVAHITIHIGDLDAAYLINDLAVGKDSRIIELALVGNKLDQAYIDILVSKAENFISRKIKYFVLSPEEMISSYNNKPVLLIWKAEPSNV